jgi:GNAT superfamily N-acetyltransferase
MRLVPWQPEDLVRRLDDVVTVYGEAMGYRAELLEARRGYIATHVRRPGFRAVATVTTDGRLAGFGYGYTSAAGQWWHDQVRGPLDEAARRRWLADCFEVVELHVRPAAQGHGLGDRQLRALLGTATGTTTLLSTP